MIGMADSKLPMGNKPLSRKLNLSTNKAIKMAEEQPIRNPDSAPLRKVWTKSIQRILSEVKNVTNTWEGAGKITKLTLKACTELSQRITILTPNNIGASVLAKPNELRLASQIFKAHARIQNRIAK